MPQNGRDDMEFPYEPRWGVMFAGAVFFTICGFVIRGKAASNDRGLVINGLIRLSPENATTFYWVLSWVSFSFIAMALAALILHRANPKKLVLSGEGLFAPKWAWSREPTFVRYADVASVSMRTVSGQNYLKIVHANGRLNVSASMLESNGEFEVFCGELTRRLAAAAARADAKKRD